MHNTIAINGTEYEVKEIGFNSICDLAEKGIDILNVKSLQKNVIVSARSILAWIADIDVEEAGNIIQEHIVNGGSVEDIAGIIQAFTKAVEESGFLNALTKGAEKKAKTPQDHKKKDL